MLVFNGNAWETMHSTGHDGVAVQIRAAVVPGGGEIKTAANAIELNGADEVTVLVAIGTSFAGRAPEKECQDAIASARRKTFAELERRHVEDHRALYRRVSIDLGRSAAGTLIQPTDARRKAMENGADDPELLALFF
jgi:alpha-L-fucosidase 2